MITVISPIADKNRANKLVGTTDCNAVFNSSSESFEFRALATL